MAILSLSPGPSAIELIAQARISQIPPELTEVPGGLYPLMSAAYEVDEYRIMSGWPVPIPDCDVQVNCLVTADGTVLGNRDEPTSLVTKADLRWVADTAYYDQLSGLWSSIQGDGMSWRGAPEDGTMPSLVTDYEYRVGDERFTGMTAVNFDSNTGDYLEANLGLAMGGTSGYTILMVMNPNSIYGNDLSVTENALWASPTTEGSWVAFSIKDQAVWMTTEVEAGQKGVPIGNGLDSTAPTYLALVVGRPQTALYAASGPSRVLVKSLAAGEVPEPLSTRFWLGNAPFPYMGTMDMALFDLGIYGRALTKAEVISEITSLSAIYGGDT